MRHSILFCAALAVLAGMIPAVAADPALTRVNTMLESGQETIRVACFGDSVTGVYYHTGGRRAWPEMLALALGKLYPKARVEVVNAGISGNTTADALKRIDRDVLARKPHLVVAIFGLNDIVRGSRPAYRENLVTIVDRCRAAGAAVVLGTPNSVDPIGGRSVADVAEFSQIVRGVAKEKSVMLADCFRVLDDIRRKEPERWLAIVNHGCHPSMLGHKLMAETVAQAVSGTQVSLADVPPPADSLRFTIAKLKAGEPVEVIAMVPYDRMIADAIAEGFPRAKVHVTPWPTEGQSLAAMAKWATGIRAKKPHLVVLAVPADASDKDDASYAFNYHQILSGSVAFGRAQWDVLPILPAVTRPLVVRELRHAELARQILAGGDIQCLARESNDTRPARQILVDWVRQCRVRPENP